MSGKVANIASGISHIEECLLNLRALVKFGLHQIESSGPDEFREMYQEWCTMMYMIKDQVDAAHDYNGKIEAMDRNSRYSTEARH